jgi:hypothetical protein
MVVECCREPPPKFALSWVEILYRYLIASIAMMDMITGYRCAKCAVLYRREPTANALREAAICGSARAPACELPVRWWTACSHQVGQRVH